MLPASISQTSKHHFRFRFDLSEYASCVVGQYDAGSVVYELQPVLVPYVPVVLFPSIAGANNRWARNTCTVQNARISDPTAT